MGCRARTTATELLRIVVQDGAIVPDPAHRLPGRGAYLHLDPSCFDTAVRRKAMTRALRLVTPFPDSAVQAHLLEVAGSSGETFAAAPRRSSPTTKADPS